MRAIIIATGYSNTMNLINEHYPLGLIPFIDKPFLQHIVESITKMGIKKIDFVLHHFPEKLEEFLGEGERWGSEFRFHLAPSNEMPYKNLKSIDVVEEKILLAHEMYLPQLDLNIDSCENKTYFASQKWTGWGVFSKEDLETLSNCGTFLKIEEYLNSKSSQQHISDYLCIDSYENTIDSVTRVLNKEFTSLLLKAKEIEPGIWLSRNVILPSNVQIKSPIYINENCKIGNYAKLNGNVVLGEGCIVSEKTSLENTIVFPKSYIGEALELHSAIVDKNRLINVQIGAEIEVADDFILGSIAENTIGKFTITIVSRLFALLLFCVTLPILFCAMLYKFTFVKKLFTKQSYVKLPTKQDENLWKTFEMETLGKISDINKLSPWKHFCFFVVPSLWQIVKGNISFIGVPPRTINEVQNLAKDWRSLYINSKIGLITEQYATGLSTDVDDLYASEAFYIVTNSLRHDVKLMSKYLLRVLKNS